MKIAEILEIADKRTKGEWFFSARTLRSEIKDEDGDIEETPDIIHVDSDKCLYLKEADAQYILYASDMEEKLRLIFGLIPQIKDYLEYTKQFSGSNGEVAFSMKVADLLTKLGIWENE